MINAHRFQPPAQHREPDPNAWLDEANCVGYWELFFENPGGQYEQARKLCNGTDQISPCPVKAECLEFALRNDLRYGMWGGMSEIERYPLHTRRMTIAIICGGCGREANVKNRATKYCSRRCQKAAKRRRAA